MAFSIKDRATDSAVRELAALKGKSLTDTVREAVEAELAREKARTPLAERLEELSRRYRTFPETGRDADKAFFDELSGGV